MTEQKQKQDWTISAEARAEVLGRVAEAKKASASSRYLQAVAVHAVVSVDGIGADRLYADQNALAVALGCSKSNVTGLKYLGRVIADTGITHTDEAWAVLSQGAGNLGTYVKSLKGAKKASKSGALKAAKAVKATTPKAVKSASEPKAGNSTSGPAFAEALATIRASVPDLSRTDATILANSLATLMTEVQDHLKSLPREAAKKSA